MIDLPAAEAIFERRGQSNVSAAEAATIARHKGSAAIRIAPFDPATAERLIAPPSDQFWDRSDVVQAVARAMAPADLPRARKVLERINDISRSGRSTHSTLFFYGLGRMAGTLAATDPAAARRLLDEAFDGLRLHAAEDRNEWASRMSAPNLMAELLPVVERVDPDRLAERVWLAAAFAFPLGREARSPQIQGLMGLSMLVSRYDRGLAAALAAPILDRLADTLIQNLNPAGSELETVMKDLTVYDPRAVEPLLRALPESARRPPVRHNDFTAASVDARVRLAAAEVLGYPVAAQPREAGRIGMGHSAYRVDD